MSDLALRITDLTYRYPGHDELVVNCGSLELSRGEQMLLTGGSGMGKSTLLHLISGLLEPASGRVEVAGEGVHGKRGAKRDLFRGRNIGMIFQTFNLLHGFSAIENVMAALMFSSIPRSEHAERARELLDRLGIDRQYAEPDELSVGQQQRVAVARAVACKPIIVLADEPTASLDPGNSVKAIELIQRVCGEQEAALLCVSHDPALVDRFERRQALAELAPAGSAAGARARMQSEASEMAQQRSESARAGAGS